MDYNNSKERYSLVDLEIGETCCEENTNNDSVLGNRRAENLLSILGTDVLGLDDSTKGECSISFHSNPGKSSQVPHENIELLIDKSSVGAESEEDVPFVKKKDVKEKRKPTKKSHKPPRPPNGPSLDAADMKLVKEISEQAFKKRARIERMKALMKMKAAKSPSSSSWNSTLSAMVITLIFCLVIIFQGICSRNSSSVSFQGSPEPAVPANSLISVQFYDNVAASNNIGPSSESPKSIEQVSGVKFRSPG